MVSLRNSRLAELWRGDQLLRNFSKLGLGEVLNRFARLCTAIVLARMLGPVELGVAATALMCFELIRIFASNGIGQLIVKAEPEKLSATCNTAFRMIWGVCIGMAFLQVIAGGVVAAWTGKPQLFWMIASLAIVYLTMPPGMVHAALLQREQQLGVIAAVGTAQISLDNLLVALLALLGFGPWAIVLPKLLTAPVWLIGVRKAISWQRDPSAGVVSIRSLLPFCAPVLASEVLVAIRFNVDKLLVSLFLGLEALGIYFFAFNAGYGLSIVLTGALTAASFPHFAGAGRNRQEMLQLFDSAVRKLVAPICLLIALQAAAIHVYVPVLFGARWEPYVTLVAVLCISAVTKPCFDLSCQLLRAAGLQTKEFQGALVFTIAQLAIFASVLPFGLLPAVIAFAVACISMQAIFVIWARNLVARQVLDTPNRVSAGAAA